MSVPLDLDDPAVVADPYPAFARARAQAPVQWHEGLQLWLAFTHAESNAVLRDRRLGRIWRDRTPARSPTMRSCRNLPEQAVSCWPWVSSARQ